MSGGSGLPGSFSQSAGIHAFGCRMQMEKRLVEKGLEIWREQKVEPGHWEEQLSIP